MLPTTHRGRRNEDSSHLSTGCTLSRRDACVNSHIAHSMRRFALVTGFGFRTAGTWPANARHTYVNSQSHVAVGAFDHRTLGTWLSTGASVTSACRGLCCSPRSLVAPVEATSSTINGQVRGGPSTQWLTETGHDVDHASGEDRLRQDSSPVGAVRGSPAAGLSTHVSAQSHDSLSRNGTAARRLDPPSTPVPSISERIRLSCRSSRDTRTASSQIDGWLPQTRYILAPVSDPDHSVRQRAPLHTGATRPRIAGQVRTVAGPPPLTRVDTADRRFTRLAAVPELP